MGKNDERRPDQEQDRSQEATLEAGLKAAFGEVPQGRLVQHMQESLGLDSRILLRDQEEDSSPLTLSAGDSDERQAGRYRLQGEIARGGVGVVLKGRDDDLGRDVAVKMLKKDFQEYPAMLQRFVEEAQIGGQLQHPGILPVFELGRTGRGRLFFSMKLLRGQTLAKLLRERTDLESGRLKVLGIFEQVCQTMAYAHSRGVVHRDLKPSNVMVGPFGEVQVVDWGLAKVLPQGGSAEERHAAAVQAEGPEVETIRSISGDSRSLVGSVMGTPSYMSPEQARGEIEQIDERTDVYALGAILCEILTGQPPLSGKKDQGFRQAFLDFGIDFRQQSAEQIAEIIRQSPIRNQLAHGLDLWLRTGFYLILRGNDRYSLQELRERIPALLQGDPDPLRVRLRRLAFSGRPPVSEMTEIAQADLEEMQPRTLAVLVSNLLMGRDQRLWPSLCQRGLRLYPDDLSLLDTCAAAYRRGRRSAEAVRYYTAALALRPGISGLWRSLAAALSEQGRQEEAVAALQRAADLRPDLARIHYELGQALKESGQEAAAAAAFGRCLQEGRRSPPAGVAPPPWLEECESGAR